MISPLSNTLQDKTGYMLRYLNFICRKKFAQIALCNIQTDKGCTFFCLFCLFTFIHTASLLAELIMTIALSA